MKPIKETTDTFIIRIRLETRELKSADPVWRGVIEHIDIEDDKKNEATVYFDHLDKMRSYFANYLQKMGIKIENH
ncbi:MAG TPA: hypothetical protein VK206_27080 [Anaerolineales bacterium]|nr:hypothetical protein [Anaerolineales bacterium]HLO27793.1 hypothetical protein [Anaerolineales bacterium]